MVHFEKRVFFSNKRSCGRLITLTHLAPNPTEMPMQEIHTLTPEQTLLIIQSLPFFEPFSAEEQAVFLGKNARICCYDTGEPLIQEGGEDRSLFILLAGAASVVKEGASIPMAMLGPGDLFGEVAFLTNRRRTTNVIVHPPSRFHQKSDPFFSDLFILVMEGILQQQSGKATAIAIQFHQAILDEMEISTRILLKDQIINRLVKRVDTMNQRVCQLTGNDPLLSVDEELESALLQQQTPSPETSEYTKGRIIEQLMEFMEELNYQLVVGV